MNVTFFGHRDAPQKIGEKLEAVLIGLIEQHHADVFYVGNQGGFDFMAQKILKNLKLRYPHISCMVVLAYMPGVRRDSDVDDGWETIYPDGLECTPRKYAISKRNRWMVEHSDVVITYVRRPAGGAAQFKELAEKKEKQVINIGQSINETYLSL